MTETEPVAPAYVFSTDWMPRVMAKALMSLVAPAVPQVHVSQTYVPSAFVAPPGTVPPSAAASPEGPPSGPVPDELLQAIVSRVAGMSQVDRVFEMSMSLPFTAHAITADIGDVEPRLRGRSRMRTRPLRRR